MHSWQIKKGFITIVTYVTRTLNGEALSHVDFDVVSEAIN